MSEIKIEIAPGANGGWWAYITQETGADDICEPALVRAVMASTGGLSVAHDPESVQLALARRYAPATYPQRDRVTRTIRRQFGEQGRLSGPN
jgi:hypothetical protein